jgi:hypothetical protein
LVTNRYVEESDEFFTQAQLHLQGLDLVNAQLSDWARHPDHVEKWLLKTMDETSETSFTNSVDKFRKMVATARAKVESRL